MEKSFYVYTLSSKRNAIRRERRLKKYSRAWKIDRIEKVNPNWKDLYEGLITGFPD